MDSGKSQQKGSPGQSKKQQQGGWVRSQHPIADHGRPDPVVVMTDVGIDSRAIGPTTAYSPAHNSNLIPHSILVADQGSSRVTLRSSIGKPDLEGDKWDQERS